MSKSDREVGTVKQPETGTDPRHGESEVESEVRHPPRVSGQVPSTKNPRPAKAADKSELLPGVRVVKDGVRQSGNSLYVTVESESLQAINSSEVLHKVCEYAFQFGFGGAGVDPTHGGAFVQGRSSGDNKPVYQREVRLIQRI